jgi:serine/threonine protein kinase
MDINDGGAFVNSGTYGCVFTPPLPCKRNQKQKQTDKHDGDGDARVSKLFESHAEAQAEKRINTKVSMKIDPTNQFTVKMFGSCTADLKAAEPSDELHKCKFLDAEMQKRTQLTYEYGGKDLYEYIDNYKQNIGFDVLIPYLLPMFEGLVKLKEARVCHGDIKPANLLFNARTKRVLMIDFGLMSSFRMFFKEMFPNFDFKYFYYPPELKIFRALHYYGKHADLRTAFDSAKDNYLVLGSDPTLSWEFLNDYIDADTGMRAIAERYSRYGSEAQLKKMELSIIREKLDTFSLGMTLLEIWFYIELQMSGSAKKYCQRFMKDVVAPMIQFDVYKRCTPEEAVHNMKLFLASKEVSKKNKPNKIKGKVKSNK